MRAHRTGSIASLLALAFGCLLLAALGPAAGAKGSKQAIADTTEWSHLARLWQTLLDHSSNRVYNPSLFRGLAGDVNAVDSEFAALADRGELPRPVADYLRHLFHMRYPYLGECQYTTRSSVSATPVEASRSAARWVVELQLSVLRAPLLSKADGELAQAAESNISYQLTYLYHLEKLDSEVEQRRAEMKKREEGGEKIDWKAFESDVDRRENLLLDAYRARKLPRAGVVNEGMPYVIALTRQEVSSVNSPGPGF
jgi:hypothetical protein